MSIVDFNKAVMFENATRNDEFFSLKDLFERDGEGKKYKVNGVFTFNGHFGESSFISSEGYNIQLPTHLLETAKAIKKDPESVKEINEGRVYITIYPYKMNDSQGKEHTYYSAVFMLD